MYEERRRRRGAAASAQLPLNMTPLEPHERQHKPSFKLASHVATLLMFSGCRISGSINFSAWPSCSALTKPLLVASSWLRASGRTSSFSSETGRHHARMRQCAIDS